MRRAILASTGMVFAVLVWGVATAGDEGLPDEAAERMRPVIPAAVNYYNERSDDPLPVLNSSQIEDLLEGEESGSAAAPSETSKTRPKGSPATGSSPCPATGCGWPRWTRSSRPSRFSPKVS